MTPYEPILRALLPEPKLHTIRIEFKEQFFGHNQGADILNKLDALFASSDLLHYEDKLALRFCSLTNSRCWQSLAQQRALFGGRYTCSNCMRHIITDIANSDLGINLDPLAIDQRVPMSDQPLPLQLEIWMRILRYGINISCQL